MTVWYRVCLLKQFFCGKFVNKEGEKNWVTERERDRETEIQRETERQTDRQTETETERQADRQTE